MRIHKIGVILLTLLTLYGCSSQPEEKSEEEKSYESRQIGDTLKQLDLKGLKKKINNHERFMIVVTQSTSDESINMKRTLIPYFRAYKDIPFYEIEIDMLGDKVADISDNIEQIKQLAPGFQEMLPEYFYYDDGVVQERASGEMSETQWQNFMIDTGFIKGKKESEKKPYTITESKYLKEIDTFEMKEMMEKHTDFYAVYVSEERYSAMLMKTLKEYTEKHERVIYMMNKTKQDQPATEEEAEQINQNMEYIDSKLTVEMIPTLYHIKNGSVMDKLEDNVSEKEIEDWFKKNNKFE